MPKEKKLIITPRKSYVLVKPDAAESRVKANGLIVPSSVEEEQKATGTIHAVSYDISDLHKGDRVIYGAYAGETTKLREDGKEVEYKLLHDDDIIATIS
jgi:co-chaperonin GroES (HSP10)